MALTSRRVVSGLLNGNAHSVRRNKDSERRHRPASPFCAAKPDRSVKFLHDSTAHPQAESSSFIRLGSKKWLEDSVTNLHRDAHPGIRDIYADT